MEKVKVEFGDYLLKAFNIIGWFKIPNGFSKTLPTKLPVRAFACGILTRNIFIARSCELCSLIPCSYTHDGLLKCVHMKIGGMRLQWRLCLCVSDVTHPPTQHICMYALHTLSHFQYIWSAVTSIKLCARTRLNKPKSQERLRWITPIPMLCLQSHP